MVVGRSYQHTELVQLTDSTHFSHLTWLRFHSLDSSHTLPPSPPLPSLLIIPHLTPIIFHTTHITQLISHIPQLTNSSFTQLITHTQLIQLVSHTSFVTLHLMQPTWYKSSPSFSYTPVFLTHKATHVGLSGPLILQFSFVNKLSTLQHFRAAPKLTAIRPCLKNCIAPTPVMWWKQIAEMC